MYELFPDKLVNAAKVKAKQIEIRQAAQ